MKNWRGCERKPSRSTLRQISAFVLRDEKTKKDLSQLSQAPGRDLLDTKQE
jgi:hypothetical protein